MAHFLNKSTLPVISFLFFATHSMGMNEAGRISNVRTNYEFFEAKYLQKHARNQNDESKAELELARGLIEGFEYDISAGYSCVSAISNHQIAILHRHWNYPVSHEFREDTQRGFSMDRLAPYYPMYSGQSSQTKE
jgi:hypothetical protein